VVEEEFVIERICNDNEKASTQISLSRLLGCVQIFCSFYVLLHMFDDHRGKEKHEGKIRKRANHTGRLLHVT